MIKKFLIALLLFLPILSLKILRHLNNYIGILKIPRIRIRLIRALLLLRCLFITICVKSILNSESPLLILGLIILHIAAFINDDIVVVLLISDFILCWITLRFGLNHNSNKELVSNIYLIFYVVLPSAPLLFTIITEWHERKAEAAFITYRDDFVLCTYNEFFILLLMISGIAKLPVYRLHHWLPKAHVQAPTILSITLARLSLKVGLIVVSYVLFYCLFSWIFLKFLVNLFLIGLVISVYIRISCADSKVFLAYCSVSHISVRAIGIALIILDSFNRAWLLRLRHCLSSPLLFYICRNSQYSLITRIIKPNQRIKITKIAILLLLILLLDLPFPPIFSFWREVTIVQCLASTIRVLSCLIIPPIIILIRRYEGVYLSFREYMCSALYTLYIACFFVLVFRSYLRIEV